MSAHHVVDCSYSGTPHADELASGLAHQMGHITLLSYAA